MLEGVEGAAWVWLGDKVQVKRALKMREDGCETYDILLVGIAKLTGADYPASWTHVSQRLW